MSLLVRDYKRLEEIQDKIVADIASSSEMKEFLNLIIKSGNEVEMLNYMNTIGFHSIEEIECHLNKEKKNEGLSTGLIIAGGAILLAALLSR